MRTFIVILSLTCAVNAVAVSPEPGPPGLPGPAILARIPEHPRLLATANDFRSLRELIAADPSVATLGESVRRDADRILTTKPSTYEIPDGKRLLATSRQVFERTATLGLVFRLTNDPRYSDRLWRELDAAAQFKDWNPSHFLDTAEMTAAFAIGYDWLHADWSPERRTILRKAIIEKGLTPSLPIYRKDRGWAASQHNWNQVCNGGMTLGALAIAEDEPRLAAEILERAIATVPRAMKHFAPDGAWGEGPGYWDYATKYNVLMLAALDSSLGQDFGLSKIDGFSKAGDFPIHTTGPLGRSFNYADSGEGAAGGAQLLWLATKFKHPAWAAWRLKRLSSGTDEFSRKGTPAPAKPTALDLLWGASWLAQKVEVQGIPIARHFRVAHVVTMRSAWGDPDATYIGFKGGDNKVNHGHLDLGSFVLDAGGRRWAMDLGADDYNLPGYFGKGRWNFYRCRAEGQNTLVINPGAEPDQDAKAVAPITRFLSSPNGGFAIANLTAAYAKSARHLERGVELRDRAVLVQDEISTLQPSEVWWFMHTAAEVSLDGATATLTMNGRTLSARILAPKTATFQLLPAAPFAASPNPPRQQTHSQWSKQDTSRVRKLAVKLSDVTETTIAIAFLPSTQTSTQFIVRPLANWQE